MFLVNSPLADVSLIMSVQERGLQAHPKLWVLAEAIREHLPGFLGDLCCGKECLL